MLQETYRFRKSDAHILSGQLVHSKRKFTGPSGKPVIMISFPSTDMSSNKFAS